MKKLRKLIFLVVIAALSVISIGNVNAAVDQTITFHKRSLSGVTVMTGASTSYKYVDTSAGTRIGFCLNKKDDAPENGSKLYLKGEVTTPALVYILNNGYSGNWNTSVIGTGSYTNDQKYYITQLAIWMAQGTLSPSTVQNWNSALAKPALNLYNASQKYTMTPNKISLSGGTKFTLSSDGKWYNSDKITIKGSGFSKASITLVNAPAGSEIVKDKTVIKSGVTTTAIKSGSNFYVRIPADKVTSDLNVKVVVNATGTNQKVYQYESKTANRQNIGLLFKDSVKLSASLAIKLQAKGSLKILKVDNSTGKEVKLAGVTLAVKNSKGTVIARWTTTDSNNPYVINNLTPGTYTVVEEKAPNGYVKSQDIKVTVKAAKTITVKVVNTKNPSKIVISKQDITTKAELPGATLVVKDSNGKVVDKWVSTTSPHYIKSLTPGNYTLTETIAPEGYQLSKETIKFTVNKDGGVEKTIIMYNTPIPDNSKVKISKQDITTKTELPGATLVVKDSTGKVIAQWVSTTTPHYLKDLKAGKYTLTETIAPEGYLLSSEVIEFEVNADGGVEKTVVMYNTPIPEKTRIKISKQDITTKTELPGATLVVKDSTGKVIDEWVSTTTPHYLSNLAEGKYTLIETKSPEGYGLSDEVIEFEVKADGGVEQTIVMYNSPIPVTSDINLVLIYSGLASFAALAGFASYKMIKRHA